MMLKTLIAALRQLWSWEGRVKDSTSTQFLIWFGFVFFISPSTIFLALGALQTGDGKSSLPLVNYAQVWAHLPRRRIDQALYIFQHLLIF